MLSILRSEVSESLMQTEAVTLLWLGFCVLCFGNQAASTARPQGTTRNSWVLSVLFSGLTYAGRWSRALFERSGNNRRLWCLSYTFVLGLLSLTYCFDFGSR